MTTKYKDNIPDMILSQPFNTAATKILSFC